MLSMPPHTSLVGSVVERKKGTGLGGVTTTPTLPKPTATGPTTGFPVAKHRSQSAFSRSRNDTRKQDGVSRMRQVPAVESSLKAPPPSLSLALAPAENGDDWRRQMEEENQKRVESMTDEERDRERREVLERFGPSIAEVLRKAREAREGKSSELVPKKGDVPLIDTAPRSPTAGSRVIKSAMASRPSSPGPGSTSSTRSSSRTDRRLRFAEVTPQDVYVYESAPSSPKKKALALPPPTADDGPTISLGTFKGSVPNTNGDVIPITVDPPDLSDNYEMKDAFGLEEGTPEYIRRRFFPSSTPNDPSLAWIEAPDLDSDPGLPNPTLRFDLTGAPISPEVSATLPTHLGLHHHAEGSHAGYTLDDLFLLSRSTVPAQRASMLDVLGRIARKIGKSSRARGNGIVELQGQEAELRKRILAAGAEAISERGTLGIRAIEVMWVCVVAWDEDLVPLEGVELKDCSSDGALSSVPPEYLLPQVSNALAAASLPQESLLQLLAIIHRLAQESNEAATSIVTTKGLISNLVQTFLLTPYPPETDSPLPEPFAIQVLITLASASRSNASALLGPADALLRFLLTPPPSSPYPLPLATSLLSSTFRFFTTLASYGLCSQTCATAQEKFHLIRRYVLSDACHSAQLRESWLGLLEGWMVCARDPHMTTPDHDILWSQVVGWEWADDVLSLTRFLTAVEHPEVWAATWRALAAWLEGSSVNSVKGGDAEKNLVMASIREGFLTGVEHVVVENCMRGLGPALQNATSADETTLKLLAKQSNILASAIRLWLSCLPSSTQQGLESPPFSLPFPQIGVLCGKLATHSLWTTVLSAGEPTIAHTYLRPLSQLLSGFLDMSRVLPGTADDLWLAQAFTVLLRLLPGDEQFAARTIEGITKLVNSEFMNSRGWSVPPVIWEKKGLEPILPLLVHPLRDSETQVGPLCATPVSVSTSTTQRLPPLSSCRLDTRKDSPLPLSKDWLLRPLDYLLRSGDTDIFKSLPSSWDASEVELVRASLLLARVAREVLTKHGLMTSTMSREETLFGCMKVFMLEHGQQQDSLTSNEDVFRDSIVGELITNLLGPFTISSSAPSSKPSTSEGPSLESVSVRFLGTTPFYQYYTDFVGLYDAISFSQPLFASLLLPLLSMRYPPDYRKYLWVDYNHVIRTIKTPIHSVAASSLDEFLWPVESNAEVLTGYLRAMTKDKLEGFVKMMAVHHVACSIWPDLRGEEGDVADEKAGQLLRAVVEQGDFETVREVVWYTQKKDGALIPPACFGLGEDLKEKRMLFVGRCGADVKDRLEKLF